MTVPYAEEYCEDWRDRALYAAADGDGRYFFERWYDDATTSTGSWAPLPFARCRASSCGWSRTGAGATTASFPRLLPLGPVFGFLGHEVRGPGGDIARLVLERADDVARALITGIGGQDGSLLAELLLAAGLRGLRRDPALRTRRTRTSTASATGSS